LPPRQSPEGDGGAHRGVPAGSGAGLDDGLTPGLDDARTQGLDAVPGGVLGLTRELDIVAANAGAGAILGADAGALVGTRFEAHLSLPAQILFNTHVYPALVADGRVEEVFLTLTSADGDSVPVLLNAERTAGTGDVEYVALVVRIRARARWEQDLLSATKALESERAASRKLAEDLEVAARDLEARYAEEQRSRAFRDAFAGVVSHELRTPITTIFGMSHLLRARHRSMDAATLAAHLDDIESEADRLRRLTEDLLVLSRAEGGSLEVTQEPLVLGHVLRATVDSEQQRAVDHRFELALPPMLPLVLGEEIYVEQVLRNFLSNAVKYTPKGSTVWVAAAPADGGAEVRVTDEGDGLGDEPPERLWNLFYRTKGAMRQASGAGIGLFVSRALIEAMGGRTWARRAADPATGGAEFGFWLPPAADPGDEG
jgi:signal transduction histidine kinase